MTSTIRPTLLLAVLAGCAAPEDAAPAPAFCEGTTHHWYAPLDTPQLLAWPDDLLTRPDPSSPTGVRVDLDPARAPWVAELPALAVGMLRGIDAVSGFGRQGAVVLRFSDALGALPADAAASVAEDAPLQLLELVGDGVARVPYEATLVDDGRQLEVQPLRPLARGARVALVLTSDHVAADGGCVSPAGVVRRALTGGAEPPFERVQEGLQAVLAATGWAPDRISAATVFTVHDDQAVQAAIADDVRAGAWAWERHVTCEDAAEGGLVACEGSFVARDHRGAAGLSREPVGTWSLPVSVWLPESAPKPWPVLVFGHGMNGRRQHGGGVGRRFADLGFAVVAIDAVEHGDHPTSSGPGDMAGVRFLGIDLAAAELDGRRLRGAFEQSVLDRVQLVELLAQAPDVDGDGVDDLDPSRMAYLGISLGGMLGAGTVALSDRLDAAVLPVAGGHLVRFVTDTATAGLVTPLFVAQLGSEARFSRLLQVLQSVADPADPAVFGAHLVRDRLGEPSRATSVLLPVAEFDDVVPPRAGAALARAAGLAHGEPRAWEVDLLPVAALPLAGNLADGAATGAYFQLDRVGGAAAEPGTHDNVPLSEEGLALARRFLATWLDGGPPEVIDPFTELGTPELPPR